MFRRLSVFAGGLTLEAAEQVCAGGLSRACPTCLPGWWTSRWSSRTPRVARKHASASWRLSDSMPANSWRPLARRATPTHPCPVVHRARPVARPGTRRPGRRRAEPMVCSGAREPSGRPRHGPSRRPRRCSRRDGCRVAGLDGAGPARGGPSLADPSPGRLLRPRGLNARALFATAVFEVRLGRPGVSQLGAADRGTCATRRPGPRRRGGPPAGDADLVRRRLGSSRRAGRGLDAAAGERPAYSPRTITSGRCSRSAAATRAARAAARQQRRPGRSHRTRRLLLGLFPGFLGGHRGSCSSRLRGDHARRAPGGRRAGAGVRPRPPCPWPSGWRATSAPPAPPSTGLGASSPPWATAPAGARAGAARTPVARDGPARRGEPP